MKIDFIESMGSKDNIDQELQLLAGSYKLPEALIAAVKRYKVDKETEKEPEREQEQNKSVKN